MKNIRLLIYGRTIEAICHPEMICGEDSFSVVDGRQAEIATTVHRHSAGREFQRMGAAIPNNRLPTVKTVYIGRGEKLTGILERSKTTTSGLAYVRQRFEPYGMVLRGYKCT
jgi:hypothetical protein